MNPMRFLHGLSLVIIVTANLSGQEAKPLIDAAAKIYAECQAYSVELDNRTLQLKPVSVVAGAARDYEVISTQYRRLHLKVQRPYGYWLMAQLWQEGATAGSDSSGAVAFSIVARSDDTLPRQGVLEGGKFSVLAAPAEQFNAMANTRLGPQASEDVILRYFHAHRMDQEKGVSLGLAEADVIGRETINGHTTFRIVGKTANGHSVMLWIDQESSLVVRSILWYSGTGREAAAQTLTVIETFYNNQKINPVFAAADFLVAKPMATGRVPALQMGFGETTDLLKLAEILPR